MPTPRTSKLKHSVRRGTRVLHYFMIHVAPKRGSRRSRWAGAYVSCWINFHLGDGALAVAKHYIRESGWAPRRVHEHNWPSHRDYRGHKSLQYFDEAMTGGCSFVYHLYRRNDSKWGARDARAVAAKHVRAD